MNLQNWVLPMKQYLIQTQEKRISYMSSSFTYKSIAFSSFSITFIRFDFPFVCQESKSNFQMGSIQEVAQSNIKAQKRTPQDLDYIFYPMLCFEKGLYLMYIIFRVSKRVQKKKKIQTFEVQSNVHILTSIRKASTSAEEKEKTGRIKLISEYRNQIEQMKLSFIQK